MEKKTKEVSFGPQGHTATVTVYLHGPISRPIDESALEFDAVVATLRGALGRRIQFGVWGFGDRGEEGGAQ